jgi:hypothetical protein
MHRIMTVALMFALSWPLAAQADEAQIKSAESAGPASIAKKATIKDWEMKVIRTGTNGWTCLPDNPNTEGTDPWCVNDPWLNFLAAMTKKEKPTYTGVGIAYMLQGDAAVSNTDPFATEPKPGDDWVKGLKSHVMILVPDRQALSNISTDSKNGGAWIMWPDTPYAHLMLPIDSYPSK